MSKCKVIVVVDVVAKGVDDDDDGEMDDNRVF